MKLVTMQPQCYDTIPVASNKERNQLECSIRKEGLRVSLSDVVFNFTISDFFLLHI